MIRAQAARLQNVDRAFQRAELAAILQEAVVLLRLFALPDAAFALRVVGVIVVLVNGVNVTGKVHDGGAGGKRVPDQPVVPAGAADNEARSFLIIEPFREDEVVDPLRRTLAVGLESEVANRFFPAFALKVQGHAYIHVPAAASKKKIFLEAGNGFDGAAKVAHEQDVAIRVTKNVVSGEFLRLVEDAGEVLCAVTVAADFRDVADAQFVADCGGAFFVAKQDDLDAGMETSPALQRVALDDRDVSDEWFRRGEQREHLSLMYARRGKSKRGGARENGVQGLS